MLRPTFYIDSVYPDLYIGVQGKDIYPPASIRDNFCSNHLFFQDQQADILGFKTDIPVTGTGPSLVMTSHGTINTAYCDRHLGNLDAADEGSILIL